MYRLYRKMTMNEWSFLARLHEREALWPSGRASDSRARGRGFDPHSGRCVVSLLSKIHLPPKKYCSYPGSGGFIPT